MNPFFRFLLTYFIYLEMIYLAIIGMWWIKTPPETTVEWVSLIAATFFTLISFIWCLQENKLLRNNPEKALTALLGICKYYPGLSQQQVINKLTIKYPFVPAKVFHRAFEQAIAEKYVSGEKTK